MVPISDTNVITLAADSFAIQIQRRWGIVSSRAISCERHIPQQRHGAASGCIKRLRQRLIIGALAHARVEFRMALLAGVAGIVHLVRAGHKIDIAVLAQAGHAVGGIRLEVLGAERHAACRFGDGPKIYAFTHAHTDDRILSQCA